MFTHFSSRMLKKIRNILKHSFTPITIVYHVTNELPNVRRVCKPNEIYEFLL